MVGWQFHRAGRSAEKRGAWSTAFVRETAQEMEFRKEDQCRQMVEIDHLCALSILTDYVQTHRESSTDVVEWSQYFYSSFRWMRRQKGKNGEMGRIQKAAKPGSMPTEEPTQQTGRGGNKRAV